MKVEFLAKDAKPNARALATAETAIGADGVDHGVVVACNVSEASAWNAKKSKAKQELADLIDAQRPGLERELGREPNSGELIAALLEGELKARFRVVKA